MNAEEIREFCMSLQGVEESFPFDNDTLVFKVGGKIFLLMGLASKPLQFNAKCDPDKAIELRENHSCIIPGYHMNKMHWNTVICDGSLSKKLYLALIKDSYDIITNSLPKKTKEAFNL